MLDVLKDAFKTAVRKPLTYFALIGIPAIVCCFGLLYVATFMDPYESMKELPIAIINEDAGCVADDEEKNYGSDLVDSILETDSAKWTIENSSICDDGLENTDYFMAVVIPSDFSEKVSAGQTKEPEEANIVFYKNARKNYMLSTMASKIESALREKVNEKITEQYANAYLDGLQTAGDGYGEAGDGATELSDGIGTASEGSSSLASGAATLTDGAGSLQSGIGTISSGLSALNEKSETLTSGSSQVQSGIDKLAAGTQTHAQTLSSKQKELASQVGGDPTSAVAALKQQYAQALKEYTTNIVIAAKTGQDPTAVDSSEVTAAVTSLAQASSVVGAYQALDTAAEGFTSIEEGAETLSSSYSQVDEGISFYTAAVAQLAEGAQSAESGAAQVTDGASQLQSGSESLTEGLNTAKDGADTLASSLYDGQQTIDDSMTASVDDTASYIASPVEVNDEVYGDLGKFGYGFAPLFLTICLWLGSLMIFFIFDPFPSREHLDCGRFSAVFGRWPLYAVLAAINAASACVGAMLLDLPITDSGMFIALFVVDAVSFLCIMQFLNLFDTAGKALGVLLVIFQIVCCSGTMPAILGSDFAQTVGPCLPFYYSIDAFREIMSGGVTEVALQNMEVLLAFGAGALVLSLVTYPLALKMKKRRDREAVKDITACEYNESEGAFQPATANAN